MSEFWFPCYSNDLLGSFRWKCMTPAQRGAYWQLICWQMQSEDGKLPGDVGQMGALADLPLVGTDACILDAFPLGDDGKRANPRAYAEWLKRVGKIQTLRDNGRKGSDKRYGKGSGSDVANGIANATPDAVPVGIDNQNQNQIHIQKPEMQRSVQPQAATPWVPFGEFWSIWQHNRKGKADAAKAWSVLKPDRETFNAIKLDLSDRVTRDPTWAKGMVMLPATYIRGRRWEDESVAGGSPLFANAWKGAEN